MILGSIYVTAGAIVVGVPIGILTAVFMAKFCPKGLYRFLKPAVELLARNSVSRLWIFWSGSHRPLDSRAFSRQQRNQYAGSFSPVRHYDSSYYHRCQ